MTTNALLKINPLYVLKQSPQFVLTQPQYKKPTPKHSINDILQEHGPFVLKFIRKRTWDKQNAEDIYQSTMLEALKCFKNFRNESQPRTWLCGIAYNIIRNYSKNLPAQSLESIDDLSNNESMMQTNTFGTEDPSDIYSRNLQIENISKIFDELPSEMRATFDEVVSRGRSYEETAQLLNLPIGTVRSRISRAREIFRSKSR